MKIVKKETFESFELLYNRVSEFRLHKNIDHIHHNKVTGEWDLFYWFEGGGIVQGAVSTLVGECGPEVIFPIDKLNKFIKTGL